MVPTGPTVMVPTGPTGQSGWVAVERDTYMGYSYVTLRRERLQHMFMIDILEIPQISLAYPALTERIRSICEAEGTAGGTPKFHINADLSEAEIQAGMAPLHAIFWAFQNVPTTHWEWVAKQADSSGSMLTVMIYDDVHDRVRRLVPPPFLSCGGCGGMSLELIRGGGVQCENCGREQYLLPPPDPGHNPFLVRTEP